ISARYGNCPTSQTMPSPSHDSQWRGDNSEGVIFGAALMAENVTVQRLLAPLLDLQRTSAPLHRLVRSEEERKTSLLPLPDECRKEGWGEGPALQFTV